MNSILAVTAFFATISTCLSDFGLPSSCAELLLQGKTQSGIYTIYPRSWYKPIPFHVRCDMETEGGGWTLFQRRDDYEMHENFYRNWHDYKMGFGDLKKEFWLGNDHIYILTNQDHVTLRLDMEDFEGNKRWAAYSQFQVADEKSNYKLTIAGYSGDAGDSLSATDVLFTTFDKNDVNECSKMFKGGWWYTKCHSANLNGLYLKGNHTTYANGVNWRTWLGYHYSLKITEMKVRPTNFLLNPVTNLQGSSADCESATFLILLERKNFVPLKFNTEETMKHCFETSSEETWHELFNMQDPNKAKDKYVDISLPAAHELDPDDDINYDDVQLPSDPWTVCTAQCYSQRLINGLGIYGMALSVLFLMQLRGIKRIEPNKAHKFYFLWPVAVASAILVTNNWSSSAFDLSLTSFSGSLHQCIIIAVLTTVQSTWGIATGILVFTGTTSFAASVPFLYKFEDEDERIIMPEKSPLASASREQAFILYHSRTHVAREKLKMWIVSAMESEIERIRKTIKKVKPVDSFEDERPKCDAECYIRSMLPGLGMFGITFASIYFMQKPFVKQLYPYTRFNNRTLFLLPLLMASACDYKVTSFCVDNCPHKRPPTKMHDVRKNI
uniref:Fibrinogen C-terminal domain-containing protein n=1 Tax=Strigamia maritima TaxID=126957 RepID=T1IR41_STRMM